MFSNLSESLSIKVCPRLGALTVMTFLVLSAASAKALAATTRTPPPGRRAVVVDERISVLRARPDMTAPLLQRLRRARVVGVLSATVARGGERFYFVAVTSRTRGWVLARAVARSGVEAEAERVLEMAANEVEPYARVKLAHLTTAEFAKTRAAPRALLLLGRAADAAAEQVTRLAARRVKDISAERELYLLNDAALDRFNRLGIGFRVDADGERLVYDGAAYRALLRRHPRSPEAEIARTRLAPVAGSSRAEK